MLVVKVEVWPSNGGPAYEVKRVYVTNIGQDPAARVGDPWTHVYRYATWQEGGLYDGKPENPDQFVHDRDDGALVCARLALSTLIEGTNTPPPVSN